MNYEEDLAYANSILKVRLMMENQDSIFLINKINQDTFEYLTYRNCVFYSLGILKEKTTVNSLNCFSHILIHDRNITKLLNGHDRYCYIDATETGGDWYFQQSLVLEPSVLRQLLIFNVLASVPSEYEYFQLNMKTFNYFIQG